MSKPGPKPSERALIARQFGVPLRIVKKVPLGQLEACADDDARRLLLGVSRPGKGRGGPKEPETQPRGPGGPAKRI